MELDESLEVEEESMSLESKERKEGQAPAGTRETKLRRNSKCHKPMSLVTN